jgi:hypothetical protein
MIIKKLETKEVFYLNKKAEIRVKEKKILIIIMDYMKVKLNMIIIIIFAKVYANLILKIKNM